MDRGTARERAWAWPQGRAAALTGVFELPDLGRLARWLAHAFRAAIAAEATPGRLVPWVPVAFGLGVALYFTICGG
jgi:competence protein ComEC